MLQRRPSGTKKKSDKEKQGSDKETSKEKLVKTKKNSKGDSKGEEDRGEMVKVEGKAKSDGSEQGVKKGGAEYPGKVEREDVRVEAVGKVEVVGGGSRPVEKDKAGEMPEQPKTETEDDTATSLRDLKSLRSLDSSKSSKGSRGSAKPVGKRWSLMMSRKSTAEETPSEKLAEDVGGPRFETVKEPEEKCAGDKPSIYSTGSFVSYTPSLCLFES